MPALYIVKNDGQIFTFPFSKERITIGRSKDNDLVLSENTVSRRHTSISKQKNGYMISDLGSYNGTKLNGEPIASSRLKNNDAIQIGLVKLTFLTGSDTPSEDEGDSVVLSVDNDREREGQQIIQSSPLKGQGQSSELLYSLSDKLERRENHQDNSPEQGAFETQEYLFNLARSNKVLFVLYEISRQLHQIHDFRELLKKMQIAIII